MSIDLGSLSSLYRYPVKGLSPQLLTSVDLEAGACFPGDRLFALENGPSGFVPTAPAHQPKIRYLMLARNNELARLKTHFDLTTRILSITGPGGDAVSASVDSQEGRVAIEEFFADYMAEALRGPPKLLSAPGYQFMDSKNGYVSLLNLASIKALEPLAGKSVDPLRFRGNLYVEGMDAWQEFDLVGQRLQIGTAEFIGLKRTDRCAATHVDPSTGQRDIDMLGLMQRNLDHHDCGIYLQITRSGRIATADPLLHLGPAA